MSRWVIATLFLSIIIWMGLEARSHPIPCAGHADVLASLKRKFGEELKAAGVTRNKQLIELLVSAKGTWTFLLVTPDGKACLIESGDGWEKTQEPEF